MPKYENSIIYKLCHQNDLENENIYIGSTTNFRSRKCEHKYNCYTEKCEKYNAFVYKYIRENGNWNDWKMIPIEVFPCNDRKELEVRERHHIELLKPKLNKNYPTGDNKQYRNDNEEVIKEKKKEKVICDNCGAETRKGGLARHKKSKKCKNYNITK